MALPYGALIVHSTREVSAAEAPANPWFSWQYVEDNSADLQRYLQQHIILTVESVLIAMLIAFPLALLAFRYRWLVTRCSGATGVIYTIPSLALFAFIYPFTGLKPSDGRGRAGAVRVAGAGPQHAGRAGGRAGRGPRGRPRHGLRPRQMLWRVELPVALPTIMAGVRVATVSTVALVTVGVIVGEGGLGQLLFPGFNNFYQAEITDRHRAHHCARALPGPAAPAHHPAAHAVEREPS